jgi:phenylpropionate dioxygenase-like ring-hydroxylating dioxygenase large terminal subunit
MYEHGWYQIAFENELVGELTPLAFGDRHLMAIKDSQSIRIFYSVCPHRGANLARGGRLHDDAVFCPFHGYRINLGTDAGGPFCVREYPCLVQGGMVFFRLSDREEPNLPGALKELDANVTFVSGFQLQADTSIEIVMENGYDSAHFKAVHGLWKEPHLEVRTGTFGELIAEGTFEIPRSDWNRPSDRRGPVRAAYQARAFSPGVVIATLSGEDPFNYTIITTAVPTRNSTQCDIRLTLVLPNGPTGKAPEGFARALLEVSRDGLEKDRAIWNHLTPGSPVHWTAQDRVAQQFQAFCSGFYSPRTSTAAIPPAPCGGSGSPGG